MRSHSYRGRQIIALRVGDDHLQRLDDLCGAEDTDRSEAIRRLIERSERPRQVPVIGICGGVMLCDGLATGSPG